MPFAFLWQQLVLDLHRARPGLLEGALFAGDLDTHEHVGNGQNGGESVHGEAHIMHPSPD